MLSKSQARTFFLGGTVITFLIFIRLTVYALMPRNVPINLIIDSQIGYYKRRTLDV